MAKKIVESSGERHWGISILAVLGYIGAVIALVLGLVCILGSAAVGPLITKFAPENAWATNLGIAGMILLGVFFIGCAVLDFFVARGFWKGQKWARIVFLIITGLSILGALFSFEIASLIINAVLFWYVGFYKPAVNWFK